jgi:hypothetical protein
MSGTGLATTYIVFQQGMLRDPVVENPPLPAHWQVDYWQGGQRYVL